MADKVTLFFKNITEVMTAAVSGIIESITALLTVLTRSGLFWLLLLIWFIWYAGTH